MDSSLIDPAIVITCITTIGGIITTIIATVAALVKHNQIQEKDKEIQVKDKEIQGYHLPVQVPRRDKRNTVLLIALGGVGKTTLIRSLFKNKEANPDETTLGFDIYHHSSEPVKLGGENTPTKYQFYIADYKGQNVGELVRAFIVQQKKPFSPLAYGYVDSLILMVDLWPPKAKKSDPDPSPQTSFDPDRVRVHLKEWNNTALNALFGLLTTELRYVCLFT